MKDCFKKDSWNIIEEGYQPAENKVSESIFSLGNGYMGTRGNFEECFSGETLQGSYVSGIYYPDKTRVGWWKNGYPEYFAKVLNNVNWIGIDLYVDGLLIDLNDVGLENFSRRLDMQVGVLYREVTLLLADGQKLKIETERFCSVAQKELGAISYKVTAVDFEGVVGVEPYLDFDIRNSDANYDEMFWDIQAAPASSHAQVQATTKKTEFQVLAAMQTTLEGADNSDRTGTHTNARTAYMYKQELKKNETLTLYKYVSICTSFHHDPQSLSTTNAEILDTATSTGYNQLKSAHAAIWKQKWEESDVIIDGDVSAQQGIRFNIFQLHQTYTGEDARLNIGPKGFTGEKYGGSTYWDTEAYCLPFYLSSASEKVAKNLLVYRYKHLNRAIENAQKLGIKNGAALYPMVTMNGEECHNEWEITFEEIHRNGAIAYAIYDYIRYTGDESYLSEYGMEVLIAISRFWAERCNYSQHRKKYVILGVTGPNEYENNVNNNWYTNYIASWCLRYTKQMVDELEVKEPNALSEIISKTNLGVQELMRWEAIADEMYLPTDEEKGLFLQQDGFYDKDLMPASDIPLEEQPIHQNWSWDRILRSCFIKQADVLQGLYFFEDQFDMETIKRNFDFYEPMTVHESSLSPCVHSILAAKLGYKEKAYEMYLRTARLDLDNYNNDTEDGLHITSMAGSWMSVVKGFGGMKIKEGKISFDPFIPENWTSYSFKIKFRGSVILVEVEDGKTTIENISDKEINLIVNNKPVHLNGRSRISVNSSKLIEAE